MRVRHFLLFGQHRNFDPSGGPHRPHRDLGPSKPGPRTYRARDYQLYHIISYVWFPYHGLGSEPDTGNGTGNNLGEIEQGETMSGYDLEAFGDACKDDDLSLGYDDWVAVCTVQCFISTRLSVFALTPRWDHSTTQLVFVDQFLPLVGD